MPEILTKSAKGATPLDLVTKAGFDDWLAGLDATGRAWVKASGFKGGVGSGCLIPDAAGAPASAALGAESLDAVFAAGAGSTALPARTYQIRTELSGRQATDAAVAWALGAYAFDRYADKPGGKARLVWPKGADRKTAQAIVDGVRLGRDLIVTPANDLGPEDLADAAKALAKAHKAKCAVTVGGDLLKKNFPTIHAVGRASAREPRLIDLSWQGVKDGPRVTLIGKGVCFDTGGLDLKPASGMLNMKKDMGGAANVLAVAAMVMAAGLKVRLRVLIPAVENSVSGDAFRPLDVIRTRKGLTVEVGNTDAEGRLVLCDAIALAMEETPDLVVDCATLTGAARVALGPSLPALFSNDDRLADDIVAAGLATDDPLWRMPLHQPYRKMLDSDVADINNVSSGGFGGAITAALYLQAFVEGSVPWAHIDMMGWNASGAPGRPKGPETQSARALFEMLRRRYG